MISVVIPLFNKQDSIGSTINSVLRQSYRDFELIVVNDGSTDRSADIVRQYDDPRIKLLEKKNSGVSSARNEGIKFAEAEYIAFLDGDDLWDPEYLETISQMIKDFPEAGILGTSYSLLKNGEMVPAQKPFTDDFYGYVDNCNWAYGQIFWTSAVCCKRSALIEIGVFDERIAYGEDLDVWWRIMLKYPIAFCNKALATYRLDEGNRAMSKHIPLEKMYIYYYEKYTSARRGNDAFRHFIDKECMWWLFPYALEDRNNPDVKRILGQIDLREYKPSFWFRFRFPKLYNMIKTGRE